MTDQTQAADFSDDEKKLIEEMLIGDPEDMTIFGVSRRQFLKQLAVITGGIAATQFIGKDNLFAAPFNELNVGTNPSSSIENGVNASFTLNGSPVSIEVDSRMTLLDSLREKLKLTGTKKGCDHGQCGACTVIVDGNRVLSCLTLTACCQGKNVTTIEGLAKDNQLHPMQAAFVKHDGFQCGYCTPGQICSAVALMEEAKKGEASYLTENIREKPAPVKLSDDEIRERMSGNICRCGAYPNIVAAIKEVHTGNDVAQNWQFA
jgi:xanthine dehydrogenase YagT iron-sulfur-binding subunit